MWALLGDSPKIICRFVLVLNSPTPATQCRESPSVGERLRLGSRVGDVSSLTPSVEVGTHGEATVVIMRVRAQVFILTQRVVKPLFRIGLCAGTSPNLSDGFSTLSQSDTAVTEAFRATVYLQQAALGWVSCVCLILAPFFP